MEIKQEIRICLACKEIKLLTEYIQTTERDLHLTCKQCYKINLKKKQEKARLDYLLDGHILFKFETKVKVNKKHIAIKTIISNRKSRGITPGRRKKVLKRDNYRCVLCNSRKNITLHHIIPIIINPDKRKDINNIVTLCFDCHKKAHGISWNQVDEAIAEKLTNYVLAKN